MSLLGVQHYKLTTYRATEGVVLEARVERRSGGRGSGSFLPVVVYRYQVGNLSFTSDTPDPLTYGLPYQEWAEAASAGYRPGQTVTVRYNPWHPESSFVRPHYDFFLSGFLLCWSLGVGSILWLCATLDHHGGVRKKGPPPARRKGKRRLNNKKRRRR